MYKNTQIKTENGGVSASLEGDVPYVDGRHVGWTDKIVHLQCAFYTSKP
jgi:hypothetical protein